MTERPEIKKKAGVVLSNAQKDLIAMMAATILVFILSYFFNAFIFLVKMYQEHPAWLIYIDEIFSALVTLAVGSAIFAWRRLQEVKKESIERIRLQEENILLSNTKADVERIIAKQLRAELEYHKKIEEELLRLVGQNRKNH